MKGNISMNAKATLAGVLAITGLIPGVSAEEQFPGPYIGADLGLALTSDARLKEYPGAGGSGDIEFDPGIRLSLGGGWRFADWIRAGGEFGVISHSIDGADASFAHFPLLANLEFQIPNPSPIVPFFGGGPGISVTTIAIDDDFLNDGDFVDGTSADAVFVWQAYAGLRYKLNDMMSIGAIYKYFEARESNWDVDGTSTDIRLGRTRTHSFSASFSMDF
jgi:opacity protein-like surface antigen